jgi:membrane protease YdiL (CAAX protease family)
MPVKNESASGFQIAFLIVAVLLLAVPADRYFFSRWEWAAKLDIPVGRIMIFVFAGILFVAVPALRGVARDLLAVPIPRKKLPELAAATFLHLAVGFATFGAFALWWWWSGGESNVARHIGKVLSDGVHLANALSISGVVTVFAGGLIAPPIEELVFRGLLYRAWERQWGWMAAAIASSLVFAFLHPAVYISQFAAGLIFVCIFRRTGSLWAAIAMHGAYNVLVWYPLLGRFVLPAGRETGQLQVWTAQLACLAVVTVAIPVYMWMSRDAKTARARDAVDPDATILRA